MSIEIPTFNNIWGEFKEQMTEFFTNVKNYVEDSRSDINTKLPSIELNNTNIEILKNNINELRESLTLRTLYNKKFTEMINGSELSKYGGSGIPPYLYHEKYGDYLYYLPNGLDYKDCKVVALEYNKILKDYIYDYQHLTISVVTNAKVMFSYLGGENDAVSTIGAFPGSACKGVVGEYYKTQIVGEDVQSIWADGKSPWFSNINCNNNWTSGFKTGIYYSNQDWYIYVRQYNNNKQGNIYDYRYEASNAYGVEVVDDIRKSLNYRAQEGSITFDEYLYNPETGDKFATLGGIVKKDSNGIIFTSTMNDGIISQISYYDNSNRILCFANENPDDDTPIEVTITISGKKTNFINDKVVLNINGR